MTSSCSNSLQGLLSSLRPLCSERVFDELSKASASVPGRLCIERGPDGEALFKASSLSGETLLHSRRAPALEARRQLAAWSGAGRFRSSGFVAVLGLAGAHHLKALLEEAPSGSTVFLADPCPVEFLAAALALELPALIKEGVELRLSVSSDPGLIASELDAELGRRGLFMPSLFAHPGCVRAFKAEYDALLSRLSAHARRRFLECKTVGSLCGEWLANSLDNLPLSFEAPLADVLKGLHKGGSSVVAAAGPSLDKAIPWLRQCAGRVPLIAVGTAVKPLLAAGLRPDFVVLVDSDPRVASQLDGVDPKSFWLLSPSHMIPSLLERFKERLLLFSTPLVPGVNRLLAECGRLPVQFRTAGTVSLTAIELAVHLGSSRILLAGLDLAVGAAGESHASHSVYHGRRLDPKGLVSIPGSSGKDVLTSCQFSVYVEMFNSYLPELRSKGLEIWNCSKEGALLKGASPCSSEEALRLCLEGPAFDGASVEGLRLSCRPAAFSAVREVLLKASADLKARSELAASAKLLCETAFKSREDFERSGTLLAKLDCLDKELKSDNLASELCDEALQPLLISLSEASGAAVSDFEEAASKNLILYDRLGKASEWLSGRLEPLLR